MNTLQAVAANIYYDSFNFVLVFRSHFRIGFPRESCMGFLSFSVFRVTASRLIKILRRLHRVWMNMSNPILYVCKFREHYK